MMDQNKTPLLDAIGEFIHTKPCLILKKPLSGIR